MRSSILSISFSYSATREREDIRQLLCHQRHRSIERQHDWRTVDDVLHGVSLDPFLRPDVSEAVRPRPAGLFVKQLEELRFYLCTDGLRSRGALYASDHPPFGKLCQCCCDGHPLMSPPRAETSLPPPLGGSRAAVNISHVTRLGLVLGNTTEEMRLK